MQNPAHLTAIPAALDDDSWAADRPGPVLSLPRRLAWGGRHYPL